MKALVKVFPGVRSHLTPVLLKRVLAAAALALVLAVAALLAVDRAFPFPEERIRDRLAGHSVMVRAEDGTLLSWRVDATENWRLPVALKDVSPWLVKATIAAEDKRFMEHHGVDPVALARAVRQNVFHRRRVSGASTLSMQTVRLLWPRPRRLGSKLVESWRATQLDRLRGKDGVLELYFNLAPYGGNVVGAEAASRKYFGKSAAALTLGEAALLAGVPQSPSRFDPRRNADAAVRRRRYVLDRMVEAGDITPEMAERAAREPVEREEMSRRSLAAGHFVEWVRAGNRGGAGELVTTLDAEWQEKAEAVALRHGDALRGRGVDGPALVVLSLRDSAVRAYIGNVAPPSRPGWQMDLARARRQPGSLLKPILFAGLAEIGKVAPSSRVLDAPFAWRDYAPENMDRGWRGDMSAADALRQSRNMPAVRQLEQYGVDRFARLLAGMGLNPGGGRDQGLAMALGAGEQRLTDLANAYAVLGRLGRWKPIRTLGAAPEGAERTALSPAAAWLALSAMAMPEEAEAPSMVWKTGTSWNQRDAWAVVMTREAVIGVWCGRLGGGGEGWVSGAQDALPVAFDVVAALGLDKRERWLPPEGIVFRPTCARTGLVPGWQCEEVVDAPALAGKENIAVCQCRGGRDVRTAEMKSAAPAKSAGKAGRAAINITSPRGGGNYVLMDGEEKRMLLRAESGSLGEELYWFVDGRSIGVTRSGETLEWELERGTHKLVVAGGGGGESALVFTVAGLATDMAAF